MTRVNSISIPTAELRPRLDLPTIKPSPKDVSSATTGQSPAPTQEAGRGFAGGAPASSDTGAAADCPRAGRPYFAPGRSVAARSVILGTIGDILRTPPKFVFAKCCLTPAPPALPAARQSPVRPIRGSDPCGEFAGGAMQGARLRRSAAPPPSRRAAFLQGQRESNSQQAHRLTTLNRR